MGKLIFMKGPGPPSRAETDSEAEAEGKVVDEHHMRETQERGTKSGVRRQIEEHQPASVAHVLGSSDKEEPAESAESQQKKRATGSTQGPEDEEERDWGDWQLGSLPDDEHGVWRVW